MATPPKPHPLNDLMHPDFLSLIRGLDGGEVDRRAVHGAIGDWLEERGHDVLAKIVRRHHPWHEKLFKNPDGSDRDVPSHSTWGWADLTDDVDRKQGRRTGLSVHRMFSSDFFHQTSPGQRVGMSYAAAPRFLVASLSHHQFWNPDQSSPSALGPAAHFSAPVTREELKQLVKRYSTRSRNPTDQYGREQARNYSKEPGTSDYPHMDELQLAADPERPALPQLPTRASMGMVRQPQAPKNAAVWYGFRKGAPYHFENGTQVLHDHINKPQEFLGHMQRLGSPEAMHMAKAAASGHLWNVQPGDFQSFMRYDPKHLAALAGARRGDDIDYRHDLITGHPKLEVAGRGDHTGKFVTTELRPHEGRMYLESVDAPGKGGTGWGSRYFFDVLHAARKNGFHTIVVRHAKGNPSNPKANGYYTWPRLGFSGSIYQNHDLPHPLSSHATFHSLFDQPGGAEAWKRHGNDQYDLEFDTRPGSPHVRRLVKYLRESQARRREVSRTQLTKLAREDSYSWLTPGGKFIPIKRGGSHAGDALREHGMKFPEIMARGWQRVFYAGNKLYANNDQVPPNDHQKQALIDHAIEEGHTHVVHDHGDDERVLWSIHDQV